MIKTFMLVLLSLFLFNSCVTVSPKKDMQRSIATPIVAENGTIEYGGKLYKFTDEVSFWAEKENGDPYAAWLRYWRAPKDENGEWGIMRVQTYLYKQTVGWALHLGTSPKASILDKDCDGVFETISDNKERIVIYDCYVKFEQKTMDEGISPHDFNKNESKLDSV